MRPPMLIALAALLATAVPALGQGTLLIGNKGEDSLSFVDLATGRERRRVPTGRMPHEIAVSPRGGLAAVVAYGGRTIELFELATARRVRSIDLGENARPHGLLWLRDGRIIATMEGRGALAIVSAPTGDAPRVISVPTGAKGSHMVAVSSDGARAYVANMGSGSVGVIDLAAGRKLKDIAVGGQPEGIAVMSDGKRLWVADRTGDTVQVIDTATGRVLVKHRTGKTPIRVVISPDGRHAITSNYGVGTISVFDAATVRPLRTITVGEPGFAQVTALFSADGERLYVAETGIDRIAELDFASGRVLGRLPAGRNGDGLAISPVAVSAR
jgi:YVTN family beta-propeller protein